MGDYISQFWLFLFYFIQNCEIKVTICLFFKCYCMGKTEKKQTQNSKRKIDINLELQEIQNSEYFFFNLFNSDFFSPFRTWRKSKLWNKESELSNVANMNLIHIKIGTLRILVTNFSISNPEKLIFEFSWIRLILQKRSNTILIVLLITETVSPHNDLLSYMLQAVQYSSWIYSNPPKPKEPLCAFVTYKINK